jgi:hypothetical protein
VGTKKLSTELPKLNTHSSGTFLVLRETSSCDCRCAITHPFRMLSDNTYTAKAELLSVVAMTVQGIMILPYAAGGEPGRGEIPMNPISSWVPDEFLL